jgi:predicted nuclease of predicted toxin-antitoxin system
MRFYLDDDVAGQLLASALRKAGHDVVLPADVGLAGSEDAVHFAFAVRQQRVLLSRNYTDFENLHDLVVAVQGHHPGLFIIRRDDDPRRNLTPRIIVRAIANLIAAAIPIGDCCIILNHWR